MRDQIFHRSSYPDFLYVIGGSHQPLNEALSFKILEGLCLLFLYVADWVVWLNMCKNEIGIRLSCTLRRVVPDTVLFRDKLRLSDRGKVKTWRIYVAVMVSITKPGYDWSCFIVWFRYYNYCTSWIKTLLKLLTIHARSTWRQTHFLLCRTASITISLFLRALLRTL